jgi:hypothetical protein
MSVKEQLVLPRTGAADAGAERAAAPPNIPSATKVILRIG